MASTSSSDLYLAEGLIFNILSWVPWISLLRFKSVCKSWCSIISSPTFMQTHLINSKKKQPSCLIGLSESQNKDPCYIISDAVNIHTTVIINIPQDLISTNSYFYSCNGLLFHVNDRNFYNDNFEVLFIWNPLTKWLKILPNPEKESEKGLVKYGFGFDFISNDYKILRLVYIPDRDYFYSPVIIEAELYSINADSWKEIQVPNELPCYQPVVLVGSDFVNANGVLYLVESEKLLAFDLHSEVFKIFSFPNPQKLTKWSHVLDYEGSAAMIFGELDGDGSVLSLWTLDDVSWTKKFNLEADQCSKGSWVYLYLGVGQFFARCNKAEEHKYIIYDHRNKQEKKLTLPFFSKEVYFFPNQVSAATYTESLVSVEEFERGK